MPNVYKDSLNFNWADRDYLITSADCRYLKKLNKRIESGKLGDKEQKSLVEDDLESLINVIEKISVMTKSLDDKSLLENFYTYGSESL